MTRPLATLIEPAPFVTLTDASLISWNVAAAPNAIVTLSGNRTLSLTNLTSGCSGCLIVIQDATGGRDLAVPIGSQILGMADQSLIIPNAPNAITKLNFIFDGTRLLWEAPLVPSDLKVWLPPNCQRVIPSQVTGTTNETSLFSFVLPANTLKTDGDSLEIYMLLLLSGVANNRTIRIRHGSLAGSILHSHILVSATQTAVSHERRLFRSTANEVLTNELNGTSSTTNTTTPVTAVIDWSVDNTFLITGQLGSAANFITLTLARTVIYQI